MEIISISTIYRSSMVYDCPWNMGVEMHIAGPVLRVKPHLSFRGAIDRSNDSVLLFEPLLYGYSILDFSRSYHRGQATETLAWHSNSMAYVDPDFRVHLGLYRVTLTDLTESQADYVARIACHPSGVTATSMQRSTVCRSPKESDRDRDRGFLVIQTHRRPPPSSESTQVRPAIDSCAPGIYATYLLLRRPHPEK
jgi:hypothetical protein